MNNNELKIVITQADLKRYKIAFTDSGMIIDELAYASKQWTSDELWENNIGGEPFMPYDYDFEADLFSATKTIQQLGAFADSADVGYTMQTKGKVILQAGAYMALNNPEQWQELLTAYTEKLKDERTDGISKAYNEQLQKEIDSFYNQQRKEWLYGDYSNYAGVLREIKKYWEAEDIQYDDKKGDSIVFFFDKEQAKDTLENYNGEKLSEKNYKSYLLGEILDAGNAREYKDKQESEKRKIERERLSQYKKERATQAEVERKAKLLSMKLK